MIGCLPSCENKPSAPLAQSVEHLPFKQGVRGSNPRRGTKKEKHRKAVLLFLGACRFLLCKNRGRKRPLIKIVRGKPPKVSPSHAPFLAS